MASLHPYFDSFQAFLQMGGHGLYVWLSYGLTVLVLCGMIVVPLVQHKQFFRAQKQLTARLKSSRNKT